MMKISLELPNGARIEFEGGNEEFKLFTDFLADPPELVDGLGSMTPQLAAAAVQNANVKPAELGPADPLDPQHVAERLKAVSASTDIERVTVMAQLAVEAGRDGIDYRTVEQLYGDLGLKKPPRFTKTFSNAKTRNLVKSVSQGIWRPTVPGENFARLGHRQ
jgi:hypothetical protein